MFFESFLGQATLTIQKERAFLKVSILYIIAQYVVSTLPRRVSW